MEARLPPHVEAAVRCPTCGDHLRFSHGVYECPGCAEFGRPAAVRDVCGKPALVSRENAVFSIEASAALSATAPSQRRRLRGGLLYRIYKAVLRANPVGVDNAERLLEDLQTGARREPVVLEIGGGTPGPGSDVLRSHPNVRLISFDVYASSHVDFIADAHAIPLADRSVDAVWIQAVLEHVIDPARVVAEIHRVLADDGLVYAETPFIQQVHEAAFDFTRFTHSGHRWLFRRFEEVASGEITGAGSALNWSIRYFARTVTGSERISRIVALLFFWLRFTDRLGTRRKRLDAASAFYFLGRRSETALSERDVISYYEENV